MAYNWLAMHHQHHVLYRTTCTVTNRYYVGMHSTNNLNDNYKGSGRILLASIRKHGRSNHVVEILETCTTREELLIRENQIVNDEMLSDPLCMNLVRGGNTTGHEYDRNPQSAKLQAASLSKYFEKPTNRQNLSEAVKRSYERVEVRARVAKKLIEAQVIEIRRLHALGSTFEVLATQFSVTGNTIWHIVTRKTWKNV